MKNYICFHNLNAELLSPILNISQNYSKTFNANTIIRFSLPMDSRIRGNDKVVLKVFDLTGREVATLVDEELQVGTYKVEWNGDKYASGIYFYRMEAGEYVETRKMILMK